MSFGDASVAPEAARTGVGTDPRPFAAEMTAGMAPGAGLADAAGMFPNLQDPDEQYYDGLLTNIENGKYGTAAMQGLAMFGDALWAGGPVAGAVGSVGKMPLALSRALAKHSSAFQHMFKGSKIIDEVDNGPKLVFHGTNKDFRRFNTAGSELGTHLGTAEQAGFRTGIDGANMRAGYINIKNPLRLQDRGSFDPTTRGVQMQLEELGIDYKLRNLPDYKDETINRLTQARLKAAGYDGIVYTNRHEVVPNTNDRKPEGMLFSDWQRKLRDMSDAEFKQIFPEAQDSYIIFDENQFINAFGIAAE